MPPTVRTETLRPTLQLAIALIHSSGIMGNARTWTVVRFHTQTVWRLIIAAVTVWRGTSGTLLWETAVAIVPQTPTATEPTSNTTPVSATMRISTDGTTRQMRAMYIVQE